MHDHHIHTHSDADDAVAVTSSMMFIILAIVAALVILAVAFAWSPWSTTPQNRVTPGQGGSDNPNIEQPSPPQQSPSLQPSAPQSPQLEQQQRLPR